MTHTLHALLGIDIPLVQAPMAGVQGRALALAVSGAGALGSLPAAMLTPDSLGKPEASAEAILKVADAPNPPLRLILGDLLPLVKDVYAQRIQTWEEWDDVARAAKG